MQFTLIGAGNMGQAMLKGFIASKVLAPEEVRVCDLDAAKVLATTQSTGCQGFTDLSQAVKDADYILLAVKPQGFDQVLSSIKVDLKAGAVILSVAAAVKLKRMRNIIGEGFPLVRIMPNTPALVGAGVMAVCFEQLDQNRQEFIQTLLASVGKVVSCTEKQLDAIGSVSGTGPAFVMLFIEAMADGAVALGIDRQTALEIAAMTVYGSGKLALETKTHPAILKDMVCSPGGTTIQGVMALEKNGLRSAVQEAILAADRKTGQMSGE